LKQIRKRLTYANVMSSIAVFLILGGASAIAAGQLGKNSVGSKQLKSNAVTTKKIKKNAVTTKKIKKGAVDGSKVKDASLTGADINLGTLGTVPSANNANTANTAGTASNLSGQTPFFVRLGFGQSQTLASHGSVSLVASCVQEGGDDIARILEQTSQNGAVAGGNDNWEGGPAPGDFLNTDTPETDRILVENDETSGGINVDSEIDEGFVLGPDGKMLTTNSEGIALGLNYGAAGCLFAGVVNSVG
jgi:hypothetical protein